MSEVNNINIDISRFQAGLFDLLEDAKHAKMSPFELKRISENYLGMYREVKNYNELDLTMKATLRSYHPEIFKESDPARTIYYALPKSSS
ncbi:MAG: hypothetical protein AABX96_02360 [Nanoarchaeota archaeon]